MLPVNIYGGHNSDIQCMEYRQRSNNKLERDFQISKHHLVSQREN